MNSNTLQPDLSNAELLRLNLQLKELHIAKLSAHSDREKEELEAKLQTVMKQITHGRNMPKPPLTSTASLDRPEVPVNQPRRMSADILGNNERRASAVPEKLVQKLIDTGKTREQAQDLLKRLSVRRIPEEQDVEEFAVYFVKDGEAGENKELLQINAEEKMIYLYGKTGTVFEIRFQDLVACIPLGIKHILLKGVMSECYELTLENEVSRNNLVSTLENRVLESRFKDAIVISGILEKKSTLGWRSKEVKLESGFLLYKNKGDKGAYTGLIEIQAPGIKISRVLKTDNQLRISSPTGKQYIFKVHSSKIETWVKHLKNTADKAHQISAHEMSVAEEKFKTDKVTAIKSILNELESEVDECEKISELRTLISDLIDFDFGETRATIMHSVMRNRTSTVVINNEQGTAQQGSQSETTQDDEEPEIDPETGQERAPEVPEPKNHKPEGSADLENTTEDAEEQDFINFSAVKFNSGTVSFRPSNYPRMQFIKSFVREVTSDNEDESPPVEGDQCTASESSPTQEAKEEIPGGQGEEAEKSATSEHLDTEPEPKSPVAICASPVVKEAPIREVKNNEEPGEPTAPYPRPSEIKSANNLSRSNSNKLDEKTHEKADKKPTTSGIEPAPPVPAPPSAPPVPGLMGKLRKPPPQVRQLMWQPIKDSNLSRNGIWSTDDLEIDVDDVMGDEIMQLFKLSNQNTSRRGQTKLSPSDSMKKEAEAAEELKNSGYTIGALRGQRLEMLFKRHNISTEFVSDIFMRYFDIPDNTEQGAFLLELKYVQPTELDIEYFKKAKANFNDKTPITHRQMSLLCDDVHYSDKREILKTITEIEEQGTSIQKNLMSVTEFCEGLQTSQAFKKVLKYILAMGNFVNQKNSKEKYAAFSLVETLPKLGETKSTVRPNYTFLHSLATIIHKHDPDIFSELDSLDMSGVNIVAPTSEGTKTLSKGSRFRKDPFAALSAPVKLLSIMYTDAKASIERVKKASKLDDSNNQFLQKAETFLTVDCHFHLINLKDLAETLSREYDSLLKTFGQDKSTEPGLLFTAIRDFVHELVRAQRAIDRNVKGIQAAHSKQQFHLDLRNQLEKMSVSKQNSVEPK